VYQRERERERESRGKGQRFVDTSKNEFVIWERVKEDGKIK